MPEDTGGFSDADFDNAVPLDVSTPPATETTTTEVVTQQEQSVSGENPKPEVVQEQTPSVEEDIPSPWDAALNRNLTPPEQPPQNQVNPFNIQTPPGYAWTSNGWVKIPEQPQMTQEQINELTMEMIEGQDAPQNISKFVRSETAELRRQLQEIENQSRYKAETEYLTNNINRGGEIVSGLLRTEPALRNPEVRKAFENLLEYAQKRVLGDPQRGVQPQVANSEAFTKEGYFVGLLHMAKKEAGWNATVSATNKDTRTLSSGAGVPPQDNDIPAEEDAARIQAGFTKEQWRANQKYARERGWGM